MEASHVSTLWYHNLFLKSSHLLPPLSYHYSQAPIEVAEHEYHPQKNLVKNGYFLKMRIPKSIYGEH
jgi:hypothetical protein